MSKYAPLADHLLDSGQEAVSVTFADIERIIGAKLPRSAFTHRAWWSNNPTNSVITNFWLKAGYKTESVDMAGKKLVFVKTAQYPPSPEAAAHGLQDQGRVFGGAHTPAGADADTVSFSSIFGALKGTVTVHPGTDLTAPIDADWEAAR